MIDIDVDVPVDIDIAIPVAIDVHIAIDVQVPVHIDVAVCAHRPIHARARAATGHVGTAPCERDISHQHGRDERGKRLKKHRIQHVRPPVIAVRRPAPGPG
jgi:hypothetical protein